MQGRGKPELVTENMTKEFEKLPLYLTRDEVCAILRISQSSFYKRVYLGQLPITKVGGSVRIGKFQLFEYLRKRTRGGEK